ncbi:TadE family protein [Streptomyces sp. HU2014]|uniref:TadE family protein n=1 Tax=Streptomyces sp. HU2014 TaxID=2939414 RepID=UPI0032C4AA10
MEYAGGAKGRVSRCLARRRAEPGEAGEVAGAPSARGVRARRRARPVRPGARSSPGPTAGEGSRTDPGARAPRRTARDRGTASIEFLGFLPVLLLVGLAAVQLGLAAYATQQAGSAARAAARTATLDDPRMSPGDAGRAALSGWLRTDGAPEAAPCDGGGRTTATVTVEIPAVLPFLGDPAVTRRATMACPADVDPYPRPNPRSAP